MPKNTIGDLRNLMFETLERLMDEEDETMTIEKAETVAKVGQVIVNASKVEVDFMKNVGGGTGTGFIPNELDENGKTKFLS